MNKTLLAVLTALALTACGQQQAAAPAEPAPAAQEAAPVEQAAAPAAEQPAAPAAEQQPATEVDHVKARQDAFKQVGDAMKTIGDVVKGDVAYDAEQFKAVVAQMQDAGAEAFQHFGEGTQGGNAKADIWTNMAKFEEGRDKMAAAVAALNEAAQTNDLNAIKPKMGDLGGSCKSCHDAFKEKTN
ncbi:MAG: cytochrome c [Neisseriaceae bacterium]|nr:cytochrome c [Neisseriaceae bacterium]